ncbi:MAG: EamA family transporter, partial [Caldisphaera sp.]|nr:EamA family transporter [Caldisphaera sp.]
TIGGAFQFLVWNYMLRLERVNRVTMLAYIVPIGTTIAQAFLFKKIPNIIEIFGLFVIIIGVIISRYKK